MNKITKFALIAGSTAILAGSAQAAYYDVDWNITQDVSSTANVKYILITLTGVWDGKILDSAYFQNIPLPKVYSNATNTPRAVQSVELVPVGSKGETGVKFTFANNSLFAPGESLRFHAVANFQASTQYMIGEDYGFASIPAPGAVGVAGLGMLAAARRRRA